MLRATVTATLLSCASTVAALAQTFPWQKPAAAPPPSACTGRLPDMDAAAILRCLDEGGGLIADRILRNDGCEDVGETIRDLAWRVDPARVQAHATAPGWTYPAPGCDLAMEVRALVADRTAQARNAERRIANERRAAEEARDREYLAGALAAMQGRAEADLASIRRPVRRVAATPNGSPGRIDGPQVERALIAVFQSQVADDRLLLARGIRLFHPVTGFVGSVTLAGIEGLACVLRSDTEARCDFDAVTERRLDLTRFYGSDDLGRAWARVADAVVPDTYRTRLSLPLVWRDDGWRIERIDPDAAARLVSGPRLDWPETGPPCLAFSAVDILLNC